MQFGMPTLIENKTLEENIALCKDLGLDFIELNMNFPEYQADVLEDTARLIALAEKAGIYYTIHLDENLNIADFNRLVTKAYLETVRRTIEVAKRLLFEMTERDDDAGRIEFNMGNQGSTATIHIRNVRLEEVQ